MTNEEIAEVEQFIEVLQTASAKRKQIAFDILQECGWIPNGKTTQHDRQRFQKMSWFATAGPRTVNFYQRGDDGPVNMKQVKTSDVEGIRRLANEKGRE